MNKKHVVFSILYIILCSGFAWITFSEKPEEKFSSLNFKDNYSNLKNFEMNNFHEDTRSENIPTEQELRVEALIPVADKLTKLEKFLEEELGGVEDIFVFQNDKEDVLRRISGEISPYDEFITNILVREKFGGKSFLNFSTIKSNKDNKDEILVKNYFIETSTILSKEPGAVKFTLRSQKDFVYTSSDKKYPEWIQEHVIKLDGCDKNLSLKENFLNNKKAINFKKLIEKLKKIQSEDFYRKVPLKDIFDFPSDLFVSRCRFSVFGEVKISENVSINCHYFDFRGNEPKKIAEEKTKRNVTKENILPKAPEGFNYKEDVYVIYSFDYAPKENYSTYVVVFV